MGGRFPAYTEKINVPTVVINVDAEPILPIEVTADRPENMVPNSRYVAIKGGGQACSGLMRTRLTT
ncbi:hypothetical protein [Leptolyngbya sp. 7M]|uniref:hypothetical protein n=1 Tax=Leptolyngbya sp. 7M TaxID=2812896 RepID=UPI001B8ABE89|nr:hypothetical protein [Leptolyngbya sp. 7M]QYO65677.1 hypothetical protein JVX88_02490 [Leptolyngbya sp. 7M]